MYPLTSWSADEVNTRLSGLLDNGFDIEALLSATQTIEQLLKRCIKYQLNTSGKNFYQDSGHFLKKLVDSTDAKSAGKALMTLASLTKIKKAWGLYAQYGLWDTLPTILNDIAPGAWELLSSPRKVRGKSQKYVWRGAEMQLHYGVFSMRHQVVHGTYGPIEQELKFLAVVAVDLVALLLDEEKGLYAYTGWNPQERMPRFRSVHVLV